VVSSQPLFSVYSNWRSICATACKPQSFTSRPPTLAPPCHQHELHSTTTMPAKAEGLLDQSTFEGISLRSDSWKPSRLPRWSFDTIRPEFSTLWSSNIKKPLRKSAWLDGLRGFAAFLVYFHHNQLWSHGAKGNLIYENAYGFDGRRYFVSLPFVRLFFSGGHFAVAIFFVISGYVLSLKSLSLIQSGKTLNAAETVASALFRRWMRLFMPIIIVTLSWLCFRHWTKLWTDSPEMAATFGEDLKRWYYTFKNYSFVFTGNFYDFPNIYHGHLWSIPVEFRGSIIVYTALSAFSRCTRNARLWGEVSLMVYFLYIADGYYGTLFIGGMLLCDLDLLAENGTLPRFLSVFSGFKEFIFFHLFILAMYLGGVPSAEGGDKLDYVTLLHRSPGWSWLSRLKPQAVFDAKWFYLTWGAILAVASIPRLPWLKRFFETRFCQYLARISFALYLVHGLIIWSLADRVYAAVGLARPRHKEGIPHWTDTFPLSKKGPMGLELAFWLPQLILLPVTLYAAELVTKLADEPSVKFTNWLYRKTLPQVQHQQPPMHKRAFSSAC
jgi:peptidoglycan/LPS O-acetylase OafA/YrhL